MAFCLASAFVGLQPAAAQSAPTAGAFPANVAHNTAVAASRPGIPGSPTPRLGHANAAPQQADQTKVVRIYSGAGYFDGALAEQLRPILAKAFASSKNDALKVVPDAAVAAPGKAESRSKLTSAPPL